MYILKYRLKSPKFYSYTLNVAYTTWLVYLVSSKAHFMSTQKATNISSCKGLNGCSSNSNANTNTNMVSVFSPSIFSNEASFVFRVNK